MQNGVLEELSTINVLNLLETTTKALQELKGIVEKQKKEINLLKDEINKMKGEK